MFTPDYKNTYQMLRLNPTEGIVEKFREYLQTWKEKGIITMAQFKILLPLRGLMNKLMTQSTQQELLRKERGSLQKTPLT